MTAYNIVRNRVKPGLEKKFEEAIENQNHNFSGMKKLTLVMTGDRTYCLIGEWDSMESIIAARPQMIATLDTFRHMLEELSDDLGVTDPVSGNAVLEIFGNG